MHREFVRWGVLGCILCALGCGGDGGGGTAEGDGDHLGSCTGPASTEGIYGCVEFWQLPDPDFDHAAVWRSVCQNDTEGTYAEGPCPGGYVGCCVTGVATAETKRKRECYYGLDDSGPVEAVCTGFGGRWE